MRKLLSSLVILVLVLGGVGVLVQFDLISEDVRAVSGIINTNQVWSGRIYITGDVTIQNNAVVNIQPGTIIQFNSSYKITVASGSIIANGSQGSKIIFKALIGLWDSIEVMSLGHANFSWCEFWSSDNGIVLDNNIFGTYLEYCKFNNTGNSFFKLTGSKLEVVSSWFGAKEFEHSSNMSTNMNLVNITDAVSEIFIDYFVETETVDSSDNALQDINVKVQRISGVNINTEQYVGKTQVNGIYDYGRVTALRIHSISPNNIADLAYNSTVEVWDKWHGTSTAEVGISYQTEQLSNQTLFPKTTNLQLPVKFIFNYPPRIDTEFLSKIVVKEDILKTKEFKFHDNDDFVQGTQKGTNKFDNLTVSITDQSSNDIYDHGGPQSTQEKWISWSNNSGGQLTFYRTIESPYTPVGSNDYKAKVLEDIYIKVQDPFGNQDTLGPIQVEFQNIPDKPEINFWSIVSATEDIVRYINISITDTDNATDDIQITSDIPHVTYQKSNSTLKLNFPNEAGKDDDPIFVNITATDGCFYYQDSSLIKNEVTQSFNVIFHQTPDPPMIKSVIPDMVGDETNWVGALDLSNYWSDPDPDDDYQSLKWYQTGASSKYFDVSGENVTANIPLVFNLVPNLELGGARDPVTIEDSVKIYLIDKDGLTDSQNIKLKLSSTNLQPSLHKVAISPLERVSVDPSFGDTNTKFKFMIEYKDQDGAKGDRPEFVRVIIDNESYDMSETNPTDDNYRDGKKYFFETYLGPGEHQHYFECSDSKLTARHPEIPNIIDQPVVVSKLYIKTFYSQDRNFATRVAYAGENGNVTISSVLKPATEHETNKGDFGKYFMLQPKDMLNLFWIEFSVVLGDNYTNYETIWLRKADMQLAYLSNSSWTPFITSILIKDLFKLKCNVTPEPSYGYDKLFNEILWGSENKKPVFTIVGWLDADGDGYLNSEDAFPFDPAARYDRDGDGSPGDTEWVPGKGPEDSTSIPQLFEDKFPDDPAASKDKDGDGCPCEWNAGKSQNDSTSEPKLTLDLFKDNPEACLDTDLDGKPDGEPYNPKEWMDKDDDNDGMLDFWEIQWNDYAFEHDIDHRFDPKDAADGSLDWDNDGRNNLQEYKDETNPFKKDEPKGAHDQVAINMPILIVVVIAIIMILIILFLYTKMRRDQLLEHKVRADILDYINLNPGIHYRKILSDLDLQMGVLTHHLNMLERQKYIISLQDSMYRRFYPANVPINNKLILSDVQRNILEKIRNDPGVSQAVVSRELNLAKKVVSYHVKILSDADFVRMEMVGRLSKLYYLDGLDLGRVKGRGRGRSRIGGRGKGPGFRKPPEAS
jgi:predicted transcriptional regulator